MATGRPLNAYPGWNRSAYGEDDEALDDLLPYDQANAAPAMAPDESPEAPPITAAPTDSIARARGGGFSLRGPAEELTAPLLEEPTLSAPPQTNPNAPPPPPAVRSDPELDAKYRQAQMTALDQANYDPNKYGIAEGLRDNGAAALASLLDVGFNKGRGLAGIVGATAQGVAKNEAARRDGAAQAGRLAVSLRDGKRGAGGMAGGDPAFDRWYKERLINARGVDQGLREQREQGVTDRFGQKLSPESDLNTTAVTQSERKAQASTRGRINESNELKDTQADTAATIADARTDATVTSRNKALATTPTPISPEQAVDDERADRSLAAREKNTAAVRDETKQRLHAGETEKFTKDVGNMLEVAKAARRLEALYADSESKGEKDLPGIGRYDSTAFARAMPGRDIRADADLGTLRSFVQGPITGAATGGRSEEQRINELAGAATGSSEHQARAAIKNLLDVAKTRIAAYRTGREGAADEVLKSAGLEGLIEAGATPTTTPNESARATPASDSAASGEQKTTRNIIKPNGQRVTYPLSDAELQRLLSKGFKEF